MSEKHKLCQYIINKYIEEGKINWPREIKIAQKLIRFYPEQMFWEDLPPLTKLYSLAYFLSGEGINYLKERYMVFSNDGIEITLDDTIDLASLPKIGEDKKVKNVAKNLRDFLR